MSTDPAATHGEPTPPDPAQPNWAGYTRAAAIAAVVGVALYAVAGIANVTVAGGHGPEAEAAAKNRFATSYLTGFIFWASLPLGALALLMIHYLAKTSWGRLLVRPLEAASRTLPLLFVFWIPLAVMVAVHGLPSPYWWTHPTEAHAPEGKFKTLEEIEASGLSKREKAEEMGKFLMRRRIAEQVEEERRARYEGIYGFLSAPSFIGTSLVLFAIFGWQTIVVNKRGAAAVGDKVAVGAMLGSLNRFSGPGLIIWSLATTVAATLWVMSVEPSWSSTMFPVIYAVNQFLTAFALCLALFLTLVGRPPFKALMRPKFQIDMGTLMLAFTLFWSYTSFSQFMLVWIGNLPEEIPYYLRRSNNTEWWWVSMALCVLHFALPFLLLLFRDIKMHPKRLRAVAIYLVVVCAVDVVWWIEPSLLNPTGFPIFLMSIGAILGIGGVWGVAFISILKKRPLFPADQAYQLPEGHDHEHH